ncbi:hypothetical protein KQX54_005069 [Cotesia glomerata]|uniref:Uncharacterized protein n=1 Tax=Cotesia glomerata TaxID=32391 RepID=A0AAV7HUX4_COTGL|nr:hypothetical protein KQX54_005069 [Cotesia glomerata]
MLHHESTENSGCSLVYCENNKTTTITFEGRVEARWAGWKRPEGAIEGIVLPVRGGVREAFTGMNAPSGAIRHSLRCKTQEVYGGPADNGDRGSLPPFCSGFHPLLGTPSEAAVMSGVVFECTAAVHPNCF